MNNKFKILILPSLYCLYFLSLGLLALTMATTALSDPIGPRFLPIVIATLGFILSICLALTQPLPFELQKSGRVIIFLAMCFGYIVLLAAFNFIVATFCFIFGACWYAHISWKKAFIFACCATAAIKGLFFIFTLPLP